MRTLYQHALHYFRQVNWMLLVFLLLMLNVKLAVKIAAILFILLANYRSIFFKNLREYRLIYFYLAMVVIAGINTFLEIKQISTPYLITLAMGLTFWGMAAMAGFFIYLQIQKTESEKTDRTITVFFALHIAAVFLNLLSIMIETGSINPYTYKGLNQKYYISTGDHISGITFDSPVTTALIGCLATLYFLYHRKFLLSLLAMASLLMIGSNLTNLFMITVLAFAFLFRTDRVQKSLIVLYGCMLAIFITKVTPQNSEYVGRFAHKMLGLTYDLPQKNESIDFIKQQPDSLLSFEEKRKKAAVNYIDSISAAKRHKATFSTTYKMAEQLYFSQLTEALHDTQKVTRKFYDYRQPVSVTQKINLFSSYFDKTYAANAKELKSDYDWNQPGKLIASRQLVRFFKEHPGKLALGAGLGNFSSRSAFKSAAMNIAGSYPQQFSYVHPWFNYNHLFLYVFYHSQLQPKHAAENTPDSTYHQLLGEYGIIGLLAFALFYIGYFLRYRKSMTYGLPVLLLLLLAFSVEYWFEQLSIVILAELLLLFDIHTALKKKVQGGQVHG